MWAYNSVFYQIYPIGFCGAPVHNDGECLPRIRKLLDWSGYLKELGIDSIILNPIFESDNHGYDTRDFKKIDCRLGTNEDFAEVCRDLHEHDVKIVLDGVFNHVGRGFWAFEDVREKKWDSPYKDWFIINFDGNSGYNDGFWYEGWEGHFELVKLNLKNPQVVDYLLECVKYWIDTFDIDGLRLDVAYSLDHDFMRRLRSFTHELKPDFVLIGEVLFGDYNLIVNDSMLHSCTNYECYKGLYSSFNSMNMFEIAHSLQRQYGSESWCIYRGKHLMTFADNHDVTRLASILSSKEHIMPAYGLLLGMPGIPCIYYGSEWGEKGQKAPDNDYALRPCFEAPKPNELTDFIRRLISIRQSSDALCNGNYRNVVLTNHQLIFERASENEKVLAAINASGESYTACHQDLNGRFISLLEDEELDLTGELIMEPYSVRYLKYKNNDFIIIGASIIDILAQPVDIDVLAEGSRPVDRIAMSTGGDALNEASVLTALGASVKLISKIGCDTAGQYILSHCEGAKIDTSCFIRDSSIDTGINIVLVDKDGERNFLTNPNGSLRKLCPSDITDEVLKGGRYLSFASIFVSPEFDCHAMARLFSRAKEKGLIVCADMTRCKNEETLQDMAEALSYLDYIFPNYEEARLLTGLPDWDEIADAFLNCGVKHVIIKAGKEGCFIKTPSERFFADAYPHARCIDTTGAGDTFTACFLYALNQGLSLNDCARFANAGASLCIEQIGTCGGIKDVEQVWGRVI